MPDDNACDAALSTQREMQHSPRKCLDKTGVEISDQFSQILQLESHWFSVQSDNLQNHNQFTQLQNNCTHLA
jgi:hypothetical protein